MKIKIILTIAILCKCFICSSQELPATDSKGIGSKIYLQTDRASYLAGDTIWAKAYFSNHQNSPLNSLEINLVDLKKAKSVSSYRFVVSANTTAVSIPLNNNLEAGKYFLQAFGRIRNSQYLVSFTKYVEVYNSYGNNKDELVYEKVLNFYPDGGALIYNDSNYVAFKYADKMGNPFNISGKLYNSSGKVVSQIKSYHNGMGVFSFYPLQGEHYYFLSDDAMDGQKYPLMLPKKEGVVIKLDQSTDLVNYSIRSNLTLKKPHFLIVQAGDDKVILTHLKKDSSVLNGYFSTRELPSGVARLAVFSEDTLMLTEKLFFINNKEYLPNAEFTANLINNKAKGENLFSLDMNDKAFGSFAVSVTDADFEAVKTNEQNILSAFLLTGSLKEPVFSPARYFDKSYSKAQLNLALITNDWALPKWEDIYGRAATTSTVINETGVVSGTVFYKGSRRPYKNKAVSLVCFSLSDSSILTTLFTTDNTGAFTTNRLEFTGQNRLTFSPTLVNKNDFISVETSPEFQVTDFPKLPKPKNINKRKDYAPAQDKYDSLTSSKDFLENVSVTATLGDDLAQLEKKYVTLEVIMRSPGNVYDLRNVKMSMTSIWDYLSMKYVELKINAVSAGKYEVKIQDWPADIYLDDAPIFDPEQLNYLRPNDLAMIKNIAMPRPMIGSNPGRSILALYTRKGIDFTAADKNYDIKYLNGYSKVYKFSSLNNNNSKSGATTVLWNPRAATSKRISIIPIHFNNNEVTRHFKVSVEGFSESGKLMYFEKIVQ